MLSNDFILKLLDLQEVRITNTIEDEQCIKVYCSSIKKVPNGFHIHDYRTQIINFEKFRNMPLYIHLKKRRLINCKTGKITTGCFNLVPKRHRIHRCVCK